MSAFTPSGIEFVAAYLCLAVVILALAYVIKRRKAAWLMVVVTAVSAIAVSFDQPAGLRMIAVIFPTLTALKAVVLAHSPSVSLRFDRWVIFMWAWPGMRPELFRSTSYRRLDGWNNLIGRGVGFFALGLATFFAARALDERGIDNYGSQLIALVGISLMLHFGFLNVLTGLLRAIGVDVRPLFVAPLRSRSLREFWGARWNLAFNEMTNRIVFRPLAGHIGAKGALIAAFVFSGLLHELAISVPAQAGFGLPLAYFAVQGAGILAERAWQKAGHCMGSFVSHAWVTAMLVLPMPLVFHESFFDQIIRPFL